MLVVLKNKEIAERWDIFKEVLRSVPRTPDMLPNWLTNCLYMALNGELQCWLAIDQRKPKNDEFYAAFITQKTVDGITGQKALLVYAFMVFGEADKRTRIEDVRTLGRAARADGIQRLVAFCPNPISANILKKAFPNSEAIPYVTVPLGDLEA